MRCQRVCVCLCMNIAFGILISLVAERYQRAWLCVAATDGWSLCVCAFVVLLLRWCVWCGAQYRVSLAVPQRSCVCLCIAFGIPIRSG
eukprot:COSAG06_NODE_304_length_17855_cov_47.399414_6_plen_88_part_00